MQVDFYQLGPLPVSAVLPRIAARVVAGGGRLLVVVADEARAEALDTALWDGDPDGFLAHGRAGGPADAVQPILIADAPEAANGARHVALADGLWRDEALGFDRAFLLFDEDGLAGARAAWRGLAGRDAVERRFWRHDGSRWDQVA
ncbi:DNA polymerase III subunit chi [Sphingomonas sp. 1P06PA]|uniref:DNA polymerase III subunit chi n=1 Tax=Sphingomonas sp. 1P06PA TaxID=554121 RepID=UPI0039A4CA9E